MDTVGKRLKAWRKGNNLTLTDISTKTGLSTGGLSAYERDEKLIGSKTLLALWSEYNIDIAWILTGKESGNLTPEEQILVETYRHADDRGKKNIMATVENEKIQLKSSASKLG